MSLNVIFAIFLQVDIAAGGWHSAALTEEGEVFYFPLSNCLCIIIFMCLAWYTFGEACMLC